MTGNELVKDRFELGWCLIEGDAADVFLQSDVRNGRAPGPIDMRVDGRFAFQGRPDAEAFPTIICPRCGEPSWAITRHCVERHGDTDVEVRPPVPGGVRPSWMKPDWI